MQRYCSEAQGMIFTCVVRCEAGFQKNSTYTEKEEPSVLEERVEMSGFFKFLIHSFFSSWHCNKTETAQSSVYDIQNKGNQLEILLFPCSL